MKRKRGRKDVSRAVGEARLPKKPNSKESEEKPLVEKALKCFQKSSIPYPTRYTAKDQMSGMTKGTRSMLTAKQLFSKLQTHAHINQNDHKQTIN